ncbi:uncharacterized protein F5Z01DRAFT_537393 [Emericellopsis atlantica]|uniref:Uncharacterized protein n=1 Tax=Emericellopsis atlantica TaxID=2614577 RepID=A0A9P7ZR05_9HYPO|nr:uncharacterized protein F5Z01DRAFT_537393 [Emericellopsis atlantica]KAG9256085.1 hypothetical protein F5Z01DRAFT_537393 [Emericellopsis atlantica]
MYGSAQFRIGKVHVPSPKRANGKSRSIITCFQHCLLLRRALAGRFSPVEWSPLFLPSPCVAGNLGVARLEQRCRPRERQCLKLPAWLSVQIHPSPAVCLGACLGQVVQKALLVSPHKWTCRDHDRQDEYSKTPSLHQVPALDHYWLGTVRPLGSVVSKSLLNQRITSVKCQLATADAHRYGYNSRACPPPSFMNHEFVKPVATGGHLTGSVARQRKEIGAQPHSRLVGLCATHATAATRAMHLVCILTWGSHPYAEVSRLLQSQSCMGKCYRSTHGFTAGKSSIELLDAGAGRVRVISSCSKRCLSDEHSSICQRRTCLCVLRHNTIAC